MAVFLPPVAASRAREEVSRMFFYPMFHVPRTGIEMKKPKKTSRALAVIMVIFAGFAMISFPEILGRIENGILASAAPRPQETPAKLEPAWTAIAQLWAERAGAEANAEAIIRRQVEIEQMFEEINRIGTEDAAPRIGPSRPAPGYPSAR